MQSSSQCWEDLDVPTEDELLRLLGKAARAGSVPAIRELLAPYREQEDAEDDGLSVVGELAERRGARARTLGPDPETVGLARRERNSSPRSNQ